MIIYKATNKKNEKIYIGQTQNLESRKRSRKCSALTQNKKTYFDCAIRKWGWENFEFITIDFDNTDEGINEKERYWIKFYNSTDKAIGYNLSEGGKTSRGCKWTDEMRERHSKLLIEEYKTGKRKPVKSCGFSGKTHSKKSKEKMRNAHMGTECKNGLEKKIICIETGIIYSSLASAAKELGLERSCIRKSCKNPNKTSGKHHWEYYINE